MGLSPATPGQTATRIKELKLQFVTRVFEKLKVSGSQPVSLVDFLGPRSEIFQGLKGNDDDVTARKRIIADFVKQYPLLASSAAINTFVAP